MRQSVCSTEYFPLTLALSLSSLREREQEASDSCLADGCWAHSGTSVIERRWTVLPLPRGEGWGEGESSVAHPSVQSVISATGPVAEDANVSDGKGALGMCDFIGVFRKQYAGSERTDAWDFTDSVSANARGGSWKS